jgi:hypothetical protein
MIADDMNTQVGYLPLHRVERRLPQPSVNAIASAVVVSFLVVSFVFK